MPEQTARKVAAATRPRDAKGHFIPKPAQSQSTASIKGAGAVVSNIVKIEKTKTSDDENVVDIKITNPLRRITKILEQIKNKQSTTVALRFTIPLIALPLFMLAAFSMGRANVSCDGGMPTKIGLVYMLRTTEAAQNGGFWSMFDPVTSLWENKKTNESWPRTILILPDNNTLSLLNPENIDLTSFHNKRVFATGSYNSCAESLTVTSSNDIQQLQ